MRLKEIEARLAEIKNDLETRGAELTPEQIVAYETEVSELQEERTALQQALEKRAALLANLASGNPVSDDAGNVKTPTILRCFPKNNEQQPPEVRTDNPTDTVEYRTAFMNFVCRNVEIPREMRTGETTTVADTGAVIPNTIMQEIIQKLESYGNLYAGFRKTSIKGGVAIPVLDFKPVANWIDEENSSADQNLASKESITFSYHGLECKISQSILANVVTLEMFQKLFVPLAAEAMVRAIEMAAIKGDGAGKPLGVTVDPRVKKVVYLSEEEIGSWSAWHEKVKSKIKKSYRTGIFIMNQSTFDGKIDGMVDLQGQPIGRTNYGINGEEKYRFMGKDVETVEDDIIAAYDDAEDEEVIAVFMKLSDYIVNNNMPTTAVKWTDHDNNKVKNKLLSMLDGKLADANGVIIIKKGIPSA